MHSTAAAARARWDEVAAMMTTTREELAELDSIMSETAEVKEEVKVLKVAETTTKKKKKKKNKKSRRNSNHK